MCHPVEPVSTKTAVGILAPDLHGVADLMFQLAKLNVPDASNDTQPTETA